MDRETERAWIAERAKLRREIERYRTSALKTARELERVRHLREAERDEARATRAALMELNRNAKAIDAERMREALRVACETLDWADVGMRGVHEKIQDNMQTTINHMDESRVRDLERTISSVGATQTLLNRLSQMYDDTRARTRDALVELQNVSAQS